MITTKQQKWINHLSDKEKVIIKAYDPSCVEKFEKIRDKIRNFLREDIEVKHCGATGLGISGQDEIDVYVPVVKKIFNDYISKLTQLFGEPKSHYPLERARFVTEVDKKHIDIFLIDSECEGWTNCIKFENYLINNPESLKIYKELKESGNGLSVREYYTRKLEFINKILKR